MDRAPSQLPTKSGWSDLNRQLRGPKPRGLPIEPTSSSYWTWPGSNRRPVILLQVTSTCLMPLPIPILQPWSILRRIRPR